MSRLDDIEARLAALESQALDADPNAILFRPVSEHGTPTAAERAHKLAMSTLGGKFDIYASQALERDILAARPRPVWAPQRVR